MADSLNLDFAGDAILNELKKAGQYYDKELTDEDIPQDIIDSVPENLVSQFQVSPIAMESDKAVLVADYNSNTLQNLGMLETSLGKRVDLLLTDENNIRRVWKNTITSPFIPKAVEEVRMFILEILTIRHYRRRLMMY